MPTWLNSLPSNPVTDFVRNAILGTPGETRESYLTITNTDTGEVFKFQFAPDLAQEKRHTLVQHQGMRGDQPYWIPSQGGAWAVTINMLVYKVDRACNVGNITENLRGLALFKDGKLPVLSVALPNRRAIKVYCTGIRLQYTPNMVTAISKDEPRDIQVSLDLVKYTPLPKPKTAGAASASTAFYTSDEATEKVKKAKKSGGSKKSAKDVLNGILSGSAGGETGDAGGEEGMPP